MKFHFVLIFLGFFHVFALKFVRVCLYAFVVLALSFRDRDLLIVLLSWPCCDATLLCYCHIVVLISWKSLLLLLQRESGSEEKNGLCELEVENLEENLKFPDSHSRAWSDDHLNDNGPESPDMNEVTSDKVGADCVHGFQECWKLLVKFTKFES